MTSTVTGSQRSARPPAAVVDPPATDARAGVDAGLVAGLLALLGLAAIGGWQVARRRA